MSDQPITDILDVYRADPASGERHLVGEVEYHADGRLALLEAEPEHDALLRDAIQSLNAKDRIVELVPPRNEARSVASKQTARDDPEFQSALSRYMERYYGFSLEPR